MSHVKSLLDKMRTDRDDPILSSLAAADMLEEKGDTVRAEFVRVQTRLANMKPVATDYPRLKKRQRELFFEHQQEWLADAFPRLPKDVLNDIADDFVFEKGFPTYLRVTPYNFNQLLKHAEALFSADSPVAHLDVQHVCGFVAVLGKEMDKLARKAKKAGVEAPQWCKFNEVTLENYFGASDLAVAGNYDAKYNNVGNLQANIDDVKTLATRSEYSAMERLSLNNWVTEEQFEMRWQIENEKLFASDNFKLVKDFSESTSPEYRYLNAYNPKKSKACIERYRAFTEGHQNGSKLEQRATENMESILSLPLWKSLKSVDLTNAQPELFERSVGDSEIRIVLSQCSHLKSLGVSGSSLKTFSKETVERLCERLETLHIDASELSTKSVPSVISALVQGGSHLGHLKELTFTGMELRPEQIHALLDFLNDKAVLDVKMTDDGSQLAKQMQRELARRADLQAQALGVG